MARAHRRGARGGGYLLKFAAAATLLVAVTLGLVLYVLPQRYVLSSGFREGNLDLPSPRIPFEPASPLRIAAVPGISRPDAAEVIQGVPTDPAGTVRGPSEIFWDRVLPLLEARRWADALPFFREHLERYPGDVGVRREYAITLRAAGRGDLAIPVLEGLLAHEDDPGLHLLLARTLRDEHRVSEAGEHYGLLLARSRNGVAEALDPEALALEWAQALTWVGRHGAAEGVLRQALASRPGSVPLRAELARVYYYADRLEEARAVLEGLSDQELSAHGLLEARANVIEWLTPPEDTLEAVPPTLLERAVAAREADDFALADSLFRAALAERPDDAVVWQAYADFLQYEREDFEGALSALREVAARTGGADPAFQRRMAQLEIWTGRTDAARARLEGLLELDEPTPPALRADALSLLGDLSRWNGERLTAVRRYRAALAIEPDQEGADQGLQALRAEVEDQIVQTEQPGLGAVASTFADTDAYRRYDAGGAWTGLHDRWVWTTRSGARWLEGLDPAGGEGSRQGLFADFEAARWWRWGTLRTGVHGGVQNVRSSSVDPGLGASVRFVGQSGARTDLRYDHEPAFGATNTLQSAVADVRQDRLALAHARSLGGPWSAALSGEVASLDHRGTPGAERNLRLAVAASVGRSMSSSVTLGLAARALRYRDPAPDVSAVPLYWDPDFDASVGPYLQLVQPLGVRWEGVLRVSPGLAFVNERELGSDVVPDVSARVGLLREGARYRTRLEVFYGQGRFSTYRSWGADLSFAIQGRPGAGQAP